MFDEVSTVDVLEKALTVIKTRGLARGQLEDENGCVCVYGALRVAMGYDNHLSDSDPEFDNWPYDNYKNADNALKRQIPIDFKESHRRAAYYEGAMLWVYSDESLVSEVIDLFEKTIRVENKNA
jgi:hypothetical protein